MKKLYRVFVKRINFNNTTPKQFASAVIMINVNSQLIMPDFVI